MGQTAGGVCHRSGCHSDLTRAQHCRMRRVPSYTVHRQGGERTTPWRTSDYGLFILLSLAAPPPSNPAPNRSRDTGYIQQYIQSPAQGKGRGVGGPLGVASPATAGGSLAPPGGLAAPRATTFLGLLSAIYISYATQTKQTIQKPPKKQKTRFAHVRAWAGSLGPLPVRLGGDLELLELPKKRGRQSWREVAISLGPEIWTSNA